MRQIHCAVCEKAFTRYNQSNSNINYITSKPRQTNEDGLHNFLQCHDISPACYSIPWHATEIRRNKACGYSRFYSQENYWWASFVFIDSVYMCHDAAETKLCTHQKFHIDICCIYFFYLYNINNNINTIIDLCVYVMSYFLSYTFFVTVIPHTHTHTHTHRVTVTVSVSHTHTHTHCLWVLADKCVSVSEIVVYVWVFIVYGCLVFNICFLILVCVHFVIVCSRQCVSFQK